MGQLQVQWDRLRRRWVMILIIALLAGAGALGAAVVQGKTYTGRAALTIQSTDRTPEQDSVLAQGYADFFNQPASQSVLKQKAGVPDGVTFIARIAAASPIVYVEATSKDSAAAADSATKMAVAFRDDVRQNLGGGVVDELRNQLNAAQGRLAAVPPSAIAERTAVSEQISDLSKRINDLQSSQLSNQLQDLQLSAGVTANSTSAGRNGAAGLLGGLILGCLVALALGRFDNRLSSSAEVGDRLGLRILAVVAGGRDRGTPDEQRRERLRPLVNVVGSSDIPVPGSLAITSPRPSAAKSQVAVSLASLRAMQGQTTLLVQADLEHTAPPPEIAGRPGVADFLASSGNARLEGKVFGNGRALLVSPPGSASGTPTYTLFSRNSLVDYLRQAAAVADLVIIDAPAVIDSTEGQMVCSVAARTALVIEEGQTRSADAVSATEALRQGHASMLGAVVVQNSGQFGDLGLLARQQWNDVPVPRAQPAAAAPVAPGASGAPSSRPTPAVAAGSIGSPARPTTGPQPRPLPTAGTADADVSGRTAPMSRAELERARAAAGATDGPSTAAAAGAAAAGAAGVAAAVNGSAAHKPTPIKPGPTGPSSNGHNSNGPGTGGTNGVPNGQAPGNAKPTPGPARNGSVPGGTGPATKGPNGATASGFAGGPGHAGPNGGGPAPAPNGTGPNGPGVNGTGANGTPLKGSAPGLPSPVAKPSPGPAQAPKPSPGPSPTSKPGPGPTPANKPSPGPGTAGPAGQGDGGAASKPSPSPKPSPNPKPAPTPKMTPSPKPTPGPKPNPDAQAGPAPKPTPSPGFKPSPGPGPGPGVKPSPTPKAGGPTPKPGPSTDVPTAATRAESGPRDTGGAKKIGNVKLPGIDAPTGTDAASENPKSASGSQRPPTPPQSQGGQKSSDVAAPTVTIRPER